LEREHGSRVGVYAGISKTGYERFGGESNTSFASVANRVSYL
jgi:acyl transferase domain-containing protein